MPFESCKQEELNLPNTQGKHLHAESLGGELHFETENKKWKAE